MVLSTVVMMAFAVTAKSSGEPCELLAEAKASTADYAKRYRAASPIFKTDPKGNVSMECWAGCSGDVVEREGDGSRPRVVTQGTSRCAAEVSASGWL